MPSLAGCVTCLHPQKHLRTTLGNKKSGTGCINTWVQKYIFFLCCELLTEKSMKLLQFKRYLEKLINKYHGNKYQHLTVRLLSYTKLCFSLGVNSVS